MNSRHLGWQVTDDFPTTGPRFQVDGLLEWYPHNFNFLGGPNFRCFAIDWFPGTDRWFHAYGLWIDGPPKVGQYFVPFFFSKISLTPEVHLAEKKTSKTKQKKFNTSILKTRHPIEIRSLNMFSSFQTLPGNFSASSRDHRQSVDVFSSRGALKRGWRRKPGKNMNAIVWNLNCIPEITARYLSTVRKMAAGRCFCFCFCYPTKIGHSTDLSTQNGRQKYVCGRTLASSYLDS